MRAGTTLLLVLGAWMGDPSAAAAQMDAGVAGGVAVPLGTFADTHQRGFTVRGQTAVRVVVLRLQAQGGWSRFPTRPATIADGMQDEADDVYHAGLGARIAAGPLFVGGNAVWFFGEGEDGTGFVPEVGLTFLGIEAVADARLDGDNQWLGVRLGLRF